MNTSHSTIVVGILAKVQAHITGRLARGRYKIPSSDTLIAVARDLGFIEGRRGRAGGFEPTDEGLEFMGFSVEEFRSKEALGNAKIQQEKAEQARRAREERAQALREDLQKSLESVNRDNKETNA